MITIVELNKKSVLSDVGGNSLKLEGLEPCPTEERCVRRGEVTQVLCEILVPERGESLLLCPSHLRCRVLANRTMSWPVDLLAVW